MRVHLLRGLCVSAVLSFIAACSGQVTSGAAQSIDPNNRAFTLRDGGVYRLPADFSDPGIKTGGKNTATAVTIVQ